MKSNPHSRRRTLGGGCEKAHAAVRGLGGMHFSARWAGPHQRRRNLRRPASARLADHDHFRHNTTPTLQTLVINQVRRFQRPEDRSDRLRLRKSDLDPASDGTLRSRATLTRHSQNGSLCWSEGRNAVCTMITWSPNIY